MLQSIYFRVSHTPHNRYTTDGKRLRKNIADISQTQPRTNSPGSWISHPALYTVVLVILDCPVICNHIVRISVTFSEFGLCATTPCLSPLFQKNRFYLLGRSDNFTGCSSTKESYANELTRDVKLWQIQSKVIVGSDSWQELWVDVWALYRLNSCAFGGVRTGNVRSRTKLGSK